MKKNLLTTYLLLLTATVFSQTLSDFESQVIPPDSAIFGSDLSGGFLDGNIFLPNQFNPNFNSWTGWAISNDTDTLTPGFTNQYSAITGSGFDQSSNYAVFFSQDPVAIALTGEAAGQAVAGFYITNNTYAYTSMRDGDGFAKKFGGATGDDPDFFLLTIKGFHNGEVLADSIDFYLADYRFEDNSQDYIIKEWTYIDLTSFGPVDSLQLALSSTDIGQFGMNNPAYFCMDNFQTTDGVTTTKEVLPAREWMQIYPNPSSNFLQIRSTLVDETSLISIFSMNGTLVLQEPYRKEDQRVNLQSLPEGSYMVKLETVEQVLTGRFLLVR